MLAETIADRPVYELRGKGRCEDCTHRTRTEERDSHHHSIFICPFREGRIRGIDPACTEFDKSERATQRDRDWYRYHVRPKTRRTYERDLQLPAPLPAPSPLPTRCPRCGARVLHINNSAECLMCGRVVDRSPITSCNTGEMVFFKPSRSWEAV
jgi:hypothetical protein